MNDRNWPDWMNYTARAEAIHRGISCNDIKACRQLVQELENPKPEYGEGSLLGAIVKDDMNQ